MRARASLPARAKVSGVDRRAKMARAAAVPTPVTARWRCCPSALETAPRQLVHPRLGERLRRRRRREPHGHSSPARISLTRLRHLYLGASCNTLTRLRHLYLGAIQAGTCHRHKAHTGCRSATPQRRGCSRCLAPAPLQQASAHCECLHREGPQDLRQWRRTYFLMFACAASYLKTPCIHF